MFPGANPRLDYTRLPTFFLGTRTAQTACCACLLQLAALLRCRTRSMSVHHWLLWLRRDISKRTTDVPCEVFCS